MASRKMLKDFAPDGDWQSHVEAEVYDLRSRNRSQNVTKDDVFCILGPQRQPQNAKRIQKWWLFPKAHIHFLIRSSSLLEWYLQQNCKWKSDSEESKTNKVGTVSWPFIFNNGLQLAHNMEGCLYNLLYGLKDSTPHIHSFTSTKQQSKKVNSKPVILENVGTPKHHSSNLIFFPAEMPANKKIQVLLSTVRKKQKSWRRLTFHWTKIVY